MTVMYDVFINEFTTTTKRVYYYSESVFGILRLCLYLAPITAISEKKKSDSLEWCVAIETTNASLTSSGN